jgi:hypothetical protein
MSNDRESRLALCRAARKTASDSLLRALTSLRETKQAVSEVILRDKWLATLRQSPGLLPDGWYTPPPHGLGVLFGQAAANGRTNYKTLRPPDVWPRANIYWDDTSPMAYCFASPITLDKHIIGDFGGTFYRGHDKKIQNHLRRCLNLTRAVFDFIEIGMPFRQVYRFANSLFAKEHLQNCVTSTTDPAGMDIGHTVPFVASPLPVRDGQGSADADKKPQNISARISRSRIFINDQENTVYEPGMAITLEPRLIDLDDKNLPMASYHTIVCLHQDGTKELMTCFDDLFKFLAMEYMIQP